MITTFHLSEKAGHERYLPEGPNGGRGELQLHSPD